MPETGTNQVRNHPTPPRRARRFAGLFSGTRRTRGGRHRDVRGNTARAAVLGAGDGLLTNVSLVLGVAGANPGVGTVRLTGIAGLLAGAFSMAAGELVSVRAHEELVEHEVTVEREELHADPAGERRELAAMYRARGVPREDAETVARILMSNQKIALDTHAQLELGVEPNEPGSANQAAIASFLSFSAGAVLPLLPWFFVSGLSGVLASVAIGAVAALGLGAAIGAFTGRGMMRTALRQFAAAAIAASITFGIGSLLGVSTT